MRCFLLVACCAVSALGCPGGANLVTHEGGVQMNEPTLRFSVAGPTRVGAGETITLTLTLTNSGADPVAANGRFVVDEAEGLEGHFEVSFRVTGPDGEPLGFLVDVDGFEASVTDLVVIPARGEHTGEVRLDHYFALSAPGAYRVDATYRNTLALTRDGRGAFIGALDAAPITITVAPQ